MEVNAAQHYVEERITWVNAKSTYSVLLEQQGLKYAVLTVVIIFTKW